MFTIVIAGAASPRRTNLEASISAQAGFLLCAVVESGKALLPLLQKQRFDLLLMDPELPDGSAVEILSLLQQFPALRPRYVATYSGLPGGFLRTPSPLGTNAALGTSASTADVVSLLPNPGLNLICPPQPDPDAALERRIGELLFSLGMPANQKGYRYIVWALKRVEEDPEQLTLLTKSLYVEIAKHFHSNQNAVERAMRNAIGNAYRNGNHSLWLRYFPRRNHQKPPTNGELLAGLHELLRLSLVEQGI